MISRLFFGKFFAIAVMSCWVCMVQGEILTAFQVNHRCDRPVGKESNMEIIKAKQENPNAGSLVYFYWTNPGDAPRKFVDIKWNGGNYEHWQGADGDYQAIWLSSRPDEIPPGRIGEIALCLRTAFTQPTEFELVFNDGSRETIQVQDQDAPARFATIAFSPDLRTARCFIEEQNADVAVSQITVDGKPTSIVWWSKEAVNGLKVAELTFEQPLTSGKRLIFLARDKNGKAVTGASIRAFGNLSRMGTYGYGELRRYEENNLDCFCSFNKVSKQLLDTAAELQLQVLPGTSEPDPDTAGHSAIYAYILFDEPDCHDFGKWKERPLNRRLGGYAPDMLKRYNRVAAEDPVKPAVLTIDLSFTPFNYFIYAPLADISNPDIYSNTCGWNVKYIDHHLNMVKRAAGPRPFSFTYQSCWEEWSKPIDHWMKRNELLEKGFDDFRNKDKKPRGFGYNTNPDEIAIAMHYALLNGATSLFAYTDATEASQGILFHGSDILPENWEAVGRNSRKIARIASLLYPAHPVKMAEASGSVLAGTLLADRDHLLVVAVNENYTCGDEFFTLKESDTTITLPLPPWMEGKSVLRVGKNGFEPVGFRADGRILRWNTPVRNGEIFLVSSSETAAQVVIDADLEKERQRVQAMQSEQEARETFQKQTRLLREQGDKFDGMPIHGYWINAKDFPASEEGDKNAIEGWEKSGNTTMGVEWSISVDESQTGRVHELLWHGQIYGTKAQIILTAPDGSVVLEQNADLSSGKSQIWTFTPQLAGKYKLRTVSIATTPREHGIRIVRHLFRLVK